MQGLLFNDLYENLIKGGFEGMHDIDIILKVEGKGIGFAHVSSSKGFKEINRCRGLEHLLTVE